MAKYALQIRAELTARNLDSANNKLDALKEKIERIADWTEIRLEGKPEATPSLAPGPGFPKAQRLQKTSTKERA